MPRHGAYALIGSEWLAAHIGAPSVRIVDASWHMPATARDPRAEYEEEHIPGAVFFDIDEIADQESPLPHMLPSAQVFEAHMARLGIGNDDLVVVYDTEGLFSAPRAWWMLRVFGHEAAVVLDGGLARWKARNLPLETGPVHPPPAAFKARFQPRLVRSLDQMRANLESRGELVVDARSAGRFHGTEPEPRPGLRSGHIPGSLSLPYARLLDERTGMLRRPDELRAILAEVGLDLSRPVVASCGSGISAALIALAVHVLGRDDTAVYDGSWTEWGGCQDTPVEL